MSALSIPPSQKTSTSVRMESIHNYANVLNATPFVDQYRVVAVYTETEASEIDQDIMESTEIHIQTGFYEEEIVAVSADNAGSYEAASLRVEEPSETVDVAKALETLTKAFALRKESTDQDVQTGNSKDEFRTGNTPDEEKTQADKKRESSIEEVQEDSQPGDVERITDSCTNLKDNHDISSDFEEMAEEPPSEMQQIPNCAANVQRSTHLQGPATISPGWQELSEASSRVTDEESKMYETFCVPVQQLLLVLR